jgi:2-hydroxychromene-2-carboxylate isomerase
MSSVLYFDVLSPYAYLALERVDRVLREPPTLEPVLLGAIFQRRGSGSWARTPIRDLRLAEIAARAQHYGLPPFVVPPRWPSDALAAMRAAVWACEHGRVREFALAVCRAEFVHGRDPTDLRVLRDCATHAALDGSVLPEAIQRPTIKDELRRGTESAWEAGVRGVPTLIADGVVYYGDDQLELAAQAGV